MSLRLAALSGALVAALVVPALVSAPAQAADGSGTLKSTTPLEFSTSVLAPDLLANSGVVGDPVPTPFPNPDCSVPETCFEYDLTVAVPAGMAADAVKVSLVSKVGDVDLYVFQGDQEVASSAKFSVPLVPSTEFVPVGNEVVTLSGKSAKYTIRINAPQTGGQGSAKVEFVNLRTVALPNAAVSGYTVTKSGSKLTHKVTIANTGKAALTGLVVGFYDNGVSKGVKKISLAPGAKTVLTFTQTLAKGTRTYSVVADPAKKIREVSETDNKATRRV